MVEAAGATLWLFEFDGREQLAPFGAADFGGKVRAPWPNRIRDGRYRFAGREHVTPITEPERGTALHGLVLWDEWRDGAPLRAPRRARSPPGSTAGAIRSRWTSRSSTR